MQFSSPFRGLVSRSAHALAAAAALAVVACSGGSSNGPVDPSLPGDPPANPQLRQAAFILDVNTKTKKVTVTAGNSLASLRLGQGIGVAGQTGTVSPTIVGGDVLDITPSNFTASLVGQGGAEPGKVLVTFDISLTNKLTGVQLVRPGGNSLQPFPIPPSATANLVYAFPFRDVVTTTAGGTTGSQNEVLVELPNRGQVAPSTDWNGDGATLTGSPFNFFNDASCTATPAAGTSSDCFRYEGFAAPLGSGATSAAQRVGYQIDPTVSQFRTFILVAADLQNSGPPVTRTVTTRVSSPQTGVIVGATGTIAPGGFSAVTTNAATGANLSIAGVTAGPARTLTLTGLPTGCTASPATVPAISAASPDPVVLADISVTCPGLTGTVNGAINVTLAGGLATAPSLAGASITITPAGAFAPVTIAPSAAGAYSASVGYGLPSGSGTVAVTNIPAGCTPNAFTGVTAGNYAGLTSAAAQTVNFTVTCSPPPAFYQLYATIGAPSAGTVTVTWEADITTRNDASLAGADVITALQFNTTVGGPVAPIADFATECTAAAGWNIAQPGDAGLPNNVAWGFVSTNGRAQTGARLALGSCTYTITGPGSFSQTLVPGSIVSQIKSAAGVANPDIVVPSTNWQVNNPAPRTLP